MKFHHAHSKRGVALVTTIIVVAIMATITVALLQTTGTDRVSSRAVANNFQARLFAEAGLNAAIARLQTSASANMSLSLNRTSTDPSNWTLDYNTVSLNGTLVSSNSSQPDMAPIDGQTHTFQIAPGISKTTPKYSITNSEGQTIGAFSCLVLDNSAKQALTRFPIVSPRAYSTSLNEVPFITANLSAATGISADASALALLPSPATANLLFEQDLGISAKWADIFTLSPNMAPDGNPKLNLRRLKYYVDGLAISQTVGNPKAQVVEALLGQASTINATASWGGGGLTWLTSPQNPRPYTLLEARQIAANLVDYIDYDMHPTTDDVDNPTYLGTEGRLTSNGTVQGHPYVTALGFGFVFNRSGNPVGALNSTRVLGYWSLTNPWSEPINSFHSFYSVNITVSINGTASGGSLGSNASSYFLSYLDEQLLTGPTDLGSNNGSIFPQAPGTSNFNTVSFANFNSFFQAGNQQPAGMSFSNLQFEIQTVRLEYTDSNGLSSVVQILDRLDSLPIPFHIASYTIPSSQGASPVMRPGEVGNGLFLNGDPRLNFRPDQWLAGALTANSAISTSPPESTPAVNVFSGMNATTGDGEQGVPQNHTWYSTPDTANHFFVRSPPALTSDPVVSPFDPGENPNGQVAVESGAELGYLSTGLPWQTLRMVVDPLNASSGGDYSILDFIESGTFSTLTVNGSTGSHALINGKVNPTTALLPTTQGLFQDIPGLSPDRAAYLTDFFSNSIDIPSYPMTRVGSFGALPEMASPDATTKFAREDLMRRVSNLLVTQSSDFTILAYGEVINPNNNEVVSSANLTSSARLLFDSTGTPEVKILSDAFETTCGTGTP